MFKDNTFESKTHDGCTIKEYLFITLSARQRELGDMTFCIGGLENGFKLQASKELNKLKHLCKSRLLPELDDLKQQIQKQGIEMIL